MINGMLQYYMRIPDPDLLSDAAWAEKFAVLEEIRKQERKASIDDYNALFSKKPNRRKRRRK